MTPVEVPNSCSNVTYVPNNLVWKGQFSVLYGFVYKQFNRVFRYE